MHRHQAIQREDSINCLHRRLLLESPEANQKPKKFQKTPLPLRIREIYGLRVGTAWWIWEERTGHFLPKQEVIILWGQLLHSWKDLLRSSLGGSSTKAIYVVLYNLVDLKKKSNQVHLRESCARRKNGIVSFATVFLPLRIGVGVFLPFSLLTEIFISLRPYTGRKRVQYPWFAYEEIFYRSKLNNGIALSLNPRCAKYVVCAKEGFVYGCFSRYKRNKYLCPSLC
jgi:hypothetical protein